MQSAVRIPTPPPPSALPPQKRPLSRSPSPVRRVREVRDVALQDVNPNRQDERHRQLAERLRQKEEHAAAKPKTEEEKQASARAEYQKLLSMRSGGTYIPPARLRALQAQITDKTSEEYQRMAWEALKKSINGLVNKVNVSNIKHIVPELFGENLVRGRGLFCRSLMKAQSLSIPYTPIFAALAAIVNTKLPQVGELLVKRLVMQFRKAHKRNDKTVCLSSATFLAHLVNQQVVGETLVAMILLLLLNKPTDDSVEIAVGLTREVGQFMEEMNAAIASAVFDQFRNILHEQDIDIRVQYMIEVLFQVRKDKYKDNPAIKEELDLVEEEDQITHRIGLDDEIDVENGKNVFKFDADWQENEDAYKKLKAEILGEAEGSDDDEEYESGESSDNEEAKEERELEIKDQTNTDLVNLRRTIYLTVMSSVDFEEAAHKLMKVQLPAGQESELPSMIIEMCSQERTYAKFFGLISERFSRLNRLWKDLFENSFTHYYDTIHRYETNRLRNIARLFGHLLSSDAIGWHVLSTIHLNEDETTSSSRIFIKILFQDLSEAMGMDTLQTRLKDDILRPSFEGIFPMEHSNPRNTRFAINYFTSISMGGLTEEMREHLQNAPKPAAPVALPPPASASSSRSSSVSSYSSYTSSSRSRSYSRSRSPSRDRGQRRRPARSRSRSVTPPRRSGRSITPPRRKGRSITPPRRNGRSITPIPRNKRSITPPRRNGHPLSPERNGNQRGRSRSRSYSTSPSRSPSRSRAHTPPRRRRARSYSTSRSPSPSPLVRRRKPRSRSPSPVKRRKQQSSRSPVPVRRRGNTSSLSRSRSRSPVKRRGGRAREGSRERGGGGGRRYSSPERSRRGPGRRD